MLALPQVDVHGRSVSLSERTLYRWRAAYRAGGVAGLESKARPRVEASAVLDPRLLEFLRERKKLDPFASVPGLLELARQVGSFWAALSEHENTALTPAPQIR